MTTTSKLSLVITGIIIILLLLFAYNHRGDIYTYVNGMEVAKIDTVVVTRVEVVEHPPDTVIKTKNSIRTVYRERIDTVIVDTAFTKVLFDTTLYGNYLYIDYSFPEDSTYLIFEPKPDITFYKEHFIYHTIYIPKEKSSNTWIYTGVGGLVLGIITGVIISK